MSDLIARATRSMLHAALVLLAIGLAVVILGSLSLLTLHALVVLGLVAEAVLDAVSLGLIDGFPAP